MANNRNRSSQKKRSQNDHRQDKRAQNHRGQQAGSTRNNARQPNGSALNSDVQPVERTRNKRNTSKAVRSRNRYRNNGISDFGRRKRSQNINIGMLIFGVILIYIVYCVVMYFQTDHIVRYEVQEGSLATNNTFTGIILRDEKVITADSSGYINFYTYEGERVASDKLVYTLDETGRLNEYLADADVGVNALSERELAEFRNEIVNFVHNYDPVHYENTYDFKHSLKNTVLKLTSDNMMQKIDELNDLSLGSSMINFCKAPETGIVAHWTDGYESLTADNVTEEILERKDYEKHEILDNTLVESGDAAYKLSTNEEWSVVIPVESDRAGEIAEEGTVKVRFLKNQLESWATTSLLHNVDGNTYIKLDFNNSMLTFISDRFIDVELMLYEETGLKIPNSSIVQKEFFLIPDAYITSGGNSSNNGIIRQCYLEDGSISSEFMNIEVYSHDEDAGEYYVDASVLNPGDVLYKTDSQDTYTVSKKATLIGVYNINKGYADFKEINILYQNDEYSIVRANTQYGLTVYDYIVLDAESVSDDQFINK